MSENSEFKPVCRNLYNEKFYIYVGQDKWRNMSTGVEGIVDPEKAKSVFRINLEMTQLINEYPLIEDFILKTSHSLSVRVDNNSQTKK